MKLKILHITASYKPAYIYGGPIQSVGKLCEGLAERKGQRAESGKLKAESSKLKVESKKWKVESEKFNLEVFTTTANGRNELSLEAGKPVLVDGVPVNYFKRWTKDHSHFSPGLLWRLSKVLRQAQHDKLVIHIHAWWNLVSVLSCLVAKWHSVPVVLSPRGMLTKYSQYNRNSLAKRIIHHSIGKRLLRYCHIHTTSEQEKQDVLQLVQPKSITMIPNLVRLEGEKSKEQRVRNKYDEEKWLDARNLNTKSRGAIHTLTFKLLFLSRIEEKKGLELLFEAIAKLDLAYELTIAGSGEEDYIKSLKLKAESLMLGKRVKWIGQVSNLEKFSVMADHDLLVLPSYNENFANVVIECLNTGTPVLVSEYVGLADYVKTNNMGWVCSLEPNDIAQKISDAYINVVKRESITHSAPILIKSDFNDEVLVKRYMELYKRVLRQTYDDNTESKTI
ncbi:MAG: glycosyltransferase [Pedobacter agri]